jgi:hypothetical protein
VLVPRLKPLKRQLTGRERLLRCWVVDGRASTAVCDDIAHLGIWIPALIWKTGARPTDLDYPD